MKREQLRLMTYTGVFAALIFLTTYVVHVPTGVNGGYIHFGDSLIYIAASILPMPYAMAASAIGAGLSDLLSPGGAVWILPTILIKPLCCLPFKRGGPLLSRRNAFGTVIAGIVCVVGYSAALAVISGNPMLALTQVPVQAVQPVGSAICFLVWGAALDKMHIQTILPTALKGDQL